MFPRTTKRSNIKPRSHKSDMGQTCSTKPVSEPVVESKKELNTATTTPGNMDEFDLKKRHGGCTGMFWRSDPTGANKLASNNDWPRDGAKLRGHVVDAKGEKWLIVAEVKQSGKSWVAAPVGAAMPFEYNNHYYLE